MSDQRTRKMVLGWYDNQSRYFQLWQDDRGDFLASIFDDSSNDVSANVELPRQFVELLTERLAEALGRD